MRGLDSDMIFLRLALLVEYIFLTTFYGLYFNHKFFTHYITQFFKFLQILVDLCGQLSWTALNTCSLTCGYSFKLYSLDCSCSVVLLESSYRPLSDNHRDVLQITNINRSGLPPFSLCSSWNRFQTCLVRTCGNQFLSLYSTSFILKEHL